MLDFKRIRKDYKLSQADLAGKLNLSVRQYGEIERGNASINLNAIMRVIGELEITVLEFFDNYLTIEEQKKGRIQNEDSLKEEISKLSEKVDFIYEYITEKTAQESIDALQKKIKLKEQGRKVH